MRYSEIAEGLALLQRGRWDIHFEANRRASLGQDIIKLTIGSADSPAPQALIDRVIDSLKDGRVGYGYLNSEDVTLAIARKYARRSGLPVSPKNVAFLPGAQTALYLAMRVLCQKGDEVLVGDPFYATYEGVIRAAEASLIPVPLYQAQNFHLDVQELERRITPRTRVVLVNTPHNPTGAVLSRGEVEAIVTVCVKYNLWIISDEVYEFMVVRESFSSPFDTVEGMSRSVVISSLSKSHMVPGFRAGWCVGPEDFIRKVVDVGNIVLFGLSPFIQDATAIAMSRFFDECGEIVMRFNERAKLFTQSLSSAPSLKCELPEAGMFVMVDVSGTGVDGTSFAWRLLDEERVSVMPGASFGARGKNFIRVSLSADTALLLDAARRIQHLASRLKDQHSMSADPVEEKQEIV